jgi:hypothetical protein
MEERRFIAKCYFILRSYVSFKVFHESSRGPTHILFKHVATSNFPKHLYDARAELYPFCLGTLVDGDLI